MSSFLLFFATKKATQSPGKRGTKVSRDYDRGEQGITAP